jgi:WD40 repeat protein
VDLIEDHTAAVAALLETRPGAARPWPVRRWRWAAGAGVAVVALVVTAAILGVPDLPGHDSGGSGASPAPSASVPATDPNPVTAVTVTAAATTGTTAGTVREAPMAYAPDGDSLATGEISGTVWLRTPGTGAPLGAVPTHSGAVTALAYGPVGNLLAVLDEEGTLGMWDVTRVSHPERLWEQPVGRGTRLAFGPGGDLLALAGAGGTNLYTVTDTGVAEYAKLPTVPTQDPYPALAFSPDGRLANIGPGGELRVWDTATGREVPGWQQRVPRLMYDAAFTPDGRLLITLEGVLGKDEGMQARVWDLATGRVLRTLPTPLGAPSAKLAVSPDGRLVAATAGPVFEGGTLWSVGTGKELATFRGPRGLIWGLAFAPDGRTLATAHGDGALRLWTLSIR